MVAIGESGFFSGAMGFINRTKRFRVMNVSIAGLDLENVYVTEEPRGFESLDGLVGNSFFREFITLIDYWAMEIVLSPKDTPPEDIIDKGWKKLTFRNDNIGIVISATIGNLGRS
ncbi:MAG: hypothetical protein C0399_12790 [Syntrophus sp. (in: bacteria)]|nr:hypothetical protein [Syntrophus sp. (in: bacteria)]